jgi:hypothetical protein
MTLVGERVLSRNNILQRIDMAHRPDDAFAVHVEARGRAVEGLEVRGGRPMGSRV